MVTLRDFIKRERALELIINNWLFLRGSFYQMGVTPLTIEPTILTSNSLSTGFRLQAQRFQPAITLMKFAIEKAEKRLEGAKGSPLFLVHWSRCARPSERQHRSRYLGTLTCGCWMCFTEFSMISAPLFSSFWL